MDGFKLIEQTLVERNIDTNQHIWYELAMSNTEYGPGWHGIIISMISKIEEIYKWNNVDIFEFKVDQIKEKNGRLRVYHTSSLKEVNSLIAEYEAKSETVCEECGAPGSLCKNGEWLQTLCSKCDLENGYERVEQIQDVKKHEE